MSDTAARQSDAAMTEAAVTEQVAEATEGLGEASQMDGLGAASFADAETREILQLLGQSDAADGCCGGGCCSV